MDIMRFNDLYLRLYGADLQRDGIALVSEFYALWLEAEASGMEADTLVKEADNCLRRIASTDLFVFAACDWIGNKGLLRLSKALAHEVSVHYLQHFKLLRFALSDVAEECAANVARRLCALDVPVAVSLGWALSMNEDLPPSLQISSTTAKVMDFLAVEHPSTCKQLLEAESSTFAHSPLALNLTERLAIDARELDALPHLVELQMSSEMRRSLRYLRRSENRAMTEQAQGQSFLADLFMTSEHFKYSNQVALEFQHEQETVETMIPMSTHEMSVDLPQTLVADPLLYGHMVMSLWRGIDE